MGRWMGIRIGKRMKMKMEMWVWNDEDGEKGVKREHFLY
jgi:hypothetical protein